MLKASTQEGDTVFVLFGGSGSELLSCRKLKRDFISCELNVDYYNFILEKLNEVQYEFDFN